MYTQLDAWASGHPFLQLAVDGWWENARVLQVPSTLGALAGWTAGLCLDDLIDVAVEVLWPGPPVVFVGGRYRNGEVPPLQMLAQHPGLSPTSALDALGTSGRQCVVTAELGVINRWKTCGPLPIPLNSSPCDLERLLAGRPDLVQGGGPLALEVASIGSRELWWAVEVGVAGDTDSRALWSTLAALCGCGRPRKRCDLVHV